MVKSVKNVLFNGTRPLRPFVVPNALKQSLQKTAATLDFLRNRRRVLLN